MHRKLARSILSFAMAAMFLLQVPVATYAESFPDLPGTETSSAADTDSKDTDDQTAQGEKDTSSSSSEPDESQGGSEGDSKFDDDVKDTESTNSEEELTAEPPSVSDANRPAMNPSSGKADKPISLKGVFVDAYGVELEDESSKFLTIKTGVNAQARFTVQPDSWGNGTAYGVRVNIFLPYFDDDGFMFEDTRDKSDVYVRADVAIGDDDGWTLLKYGGDFMNPEDRLDLGEPVNGGWFTLYLPSLSVNSSPGFTLSLDFYGEVKEGATAQIFGYVQYEDFDDERYVHWTTPGSQDADSILSLTNSNLEWGQELDILNHPVIPWDRYNYGDYIYTLTNESDKVAATIDGYEVFFEIPNYETSPHIGGALNEDIMRWIYVKDGDPVLNTDFKNTSNKEFVGIPNMGGVVIYDITDWEEGDELGDPVPYQFSGDSVVVSARQRVVDNTKPVKYLFLIPYPNSFASLPTQMTMRVSSTVYFGPGDESQKKNWSKVITRYLDYARIETSMEISKKATTQPALFGGTGIFTIDGIKNTSNIPLFHASVVDNLDNPGFPDKIQVLLPSDSVVPEDLYDWISQTDTIQYEVFTQNTSTLESSEYWEDFDLDSLFTYVGEQDGYHVWELDYRSFYDSNVYVEEDKHLLNATTAQQVYLLTGKIKVNIQERLEVEETWIGKIRVLGGIESLSPIPNEAEVHFQKRHPHLNPNKLDEFHHDPEQVEYLFFTPDESPARSDDIMNVAEPVPSLLQYSRFDPANSREIPVTDAGFGRDGAGFEYVLGNNSDSAAPKSLFTATVPVFGDTGDDDAYLGLQVDRIVLSEKLVDNSKIREILFYDIDDEDRLYPYVLTGDIIEAIAPQSDGSTVIPRSMWCPNQNAQKAVVHLGYIEVIFDTVGGRLSDEEAAISILGQANLFGILTSSSTFSFEGVSKYDRSDETRLNVVAPNPIITAYSFSQLDPVKSSSSRAQRYKKSYDENQGKGSGYEFTIGNTHPTAHIVNIPSPQFDINLPMKDGSFPEADQQYTGFQTEWMVISSDFLADMSIEYIQFFAIDDTEKEFPLHTISASELAALPREGDGSLKLTPDEHWPDIDRLGSVRFQLAELEADYDNPDAFVQFHGYADDYGLLTAVGTIEISDPIYSADLRPAAMGSADLNVLVANPVLDTYTKYGNTISTSNTAVSGLWDAKRYYIDAAYTRPGFFIYRLGNTQPVPAEEGKISVRIDVDSSDLACPGIGFVTQKIIIHAGLFQVVDLNFIEISGQVAGDTDVMRLYPDPDNPGTFFIDDTLSTVTVDNDGNLVLNYDDFKQSVPYVDTVSLDVNSIEANVPYTSDDTAIHIGGYITRQPGNNEYTYSDVSVQKENYASGVTTKDEAYFHVKEGNTQIEFSATHRAEHANATDKRFSNESIPQRYSTGSSSQPYAYDTKLEVGYKTLGSFWMGFNRPAATNAYLYNVETKFNISVDVHNKEPGDTFFDLYYMKLDPRLRNLVKEIKIYRKDDPDSVWRTVKGSDWTGNANDFLGDSSSDYWRINTARATTDPNDIFKNETDTDAPNHAYYKNPFEEDVQPKNPVVRVEFEFMFDDFEFGQDFDLDVERAWYLNPSELAGRIHTLVEFTGRFYREGSDDNSLAIELTERRGTDKILGNPYYKEYTGEKNNSRNQPNITDYNCNTARVRVFNPDARTYKGSEGRQDGGTTDPTVAGYTVTMGNEGTYKIGLLNVSNGTRENYGTTSYARNQWRTDKFATFIDHLIIRDTLPPSPNVDANHYFVPNEITANEDTMQFVDSIDIIFADKEGNTDKLSIDTKSIDYDIAIPIQYDQLSNTLTSSSITLKEGLYLKYVDFHISKIPGWGDTTAEYSGMKQEQHGEYNYYSTAPNNPGNPSGTNNYQKTDVDITIKGRVYGINVLENTSAVYLRTDKNVKDNLDPYHTAKYPNIGYLKGEPLKFTAEAYNTSASGTYTYDYGKDLYTPNRTTHSVNVKNTGEANIRKIEIDVPMFEYIRLEKITIPSHVFDGTDWKITNISIGSGKHMTAGGTETGNFIDLFQPDGNGNHVLDMESLFDPDSPIASTFRQSGTGDIQTSMTYSRKEESYWKDIAGTVKLTVEPQNDTVLAAGESLFSSNTKGIQFTGRWVDKNLDMRGNWTTWNIASSIWGTSKDHWDISRPSNVTSSMRYGANTDIYSYSYSQSSRVEARFWPENPHFVQTPTGSPNTSEKVLPASNSSASRTLTHTVHNRRADFRGELSNSDPVADSSGNVMLDVTSSPSLNIKNGDIVPGDTTTLILRAYNAGYAPATDNGDGNFPVVDPRVYLNLSKGLKIVKWEIYTDPSDAEASITQSDITMVEQKTTDSIDPVTGYSGTAKRVDFDIIGTLDYKKSVYIKVWVEATNDYDPDDLFAAQKKESPIAAYMRPGFLHGYDPYEIHNGTDNRFANNRYRRNYNNESDFSSERSFTTDFSHSYMTLNYLDISPVKVVPNFIEKDEDGKKIIGSDGKGIEGENINSFGAEVAISDIYSEAHHDETQMELYIKLDSKDKDGFILSEWPDVKYPSDWSNVPFQYIKPRLYYSEVSGGAWDDDTWVEVTDITVPHSDFSKVKRLKVDYGKLPAYKDGGGVSDGNPVMENFTLIGNAYWQNDGNPTADYYVWKPSVGKYLSHYHEGGTEETDINARYHALGTGQRNVIKGAPQLELNLTKYDAKEDAQDDDNRKSLYRPDEVIWNRIYLKNHKRLSYGDNSTTVPGTGPLIDPVVYDKVPQYLILPDTLKGDDIDIEAAILAGDVEINWYDENNQPKEFKNSDGTTRGFATPTVTSYEREEADIAGMQTFATHYAGNVRYYNSSISYSYGSTRPFNHIQPNNVSTNPAATVKYTVIKYEFPDELERGDWIEIIYKTTAEHDGLPVARYASGEDVFAPYMNMYTDRTPYSANVKDRAMDLSNLLHEAGASGTRNDYLQWGEFLALSFSHVAGSSSENNNWNHYNDFHSYRNNNYYDSTMQTGATHTIHYNKEENAKQFSQDSMFHGRTGSESSDVWKLLLKPRLSTLNSWDNDWENLGSTDLEDRERVLWTQNSLHLTKAWLYAASRTIPQGDVTQNVSTNSSGDLERSNSDKQKSDTSRSGITTEGHFYEEDGNLHTFTNDNYSYNINATRDDYTYALEFNETYIQRLAAVNYGDHDLSGVEMLEILPSGIKPVLDENDIPVVNVFYKGGEKIDPDDVEIKVIQDPQHDAGYRAPSSLMEASNSNRTYYNDDVIPWVVHITIKSKLGKWWNRGDDNNEYQIFADMSVWVENENVDGAWYDQLYVTPIRDTEHDSDLYYTLYDSRYGNYHATGSVYDYGRYFMKDTVSAGMDYNGTTFTFSSTTYHFVYEPYTMYIRGKNVECLRTTETDMGYGYTLNGGEDGKGNNLVATTGDRAYVRKPMVRLWSVFGDGSSDGMHVQAYDNVDLNIYVQNRYFWAEPGYSRWRNLTYNSSNNTDATRGQADQFNHMHQTDGGVKGTLFEPVVTNILPYGVVPVSTDGKRWPLTGPTTQQDTWDLDFTLASDTGFTFDEGNYTATVTYLEHDENGLPLNRYMIQLVPKDYDPDDRVNVIYGDKIQFIVKTYVADYPDATYVDEDGITQINSDYLAEMQKNFTYVASKRDISFKLHENDIGNRYSVGNVLQNGANMKSSANSDTKAIENYDALARDDITDNKGKIELGGVYKPIDTVKGYLETDTEPSVSTSDAMQLELHSPVREQLILDQASRYRLNGNDRSTWTGAETSQVNHGTYNTSRLFLAYPTLTATKDIREEGPGGRPTENVLADPVYSYGDAVWYALKLENNPLKTAATAKEKSEQSGDILHAQFVYTDYLPEYLVYDHEYYLQIKDPTDPTQNIILSAREARDAGFNIEMNKDYTQPGDTGGGPHAVQFTITPGKAAFSDSGYIEGRMQTGEEMVLIIKAKVNSTPDESQIGTPKENWNGSDFLNELYISLINTNGDFVEVEDIPEIDNIITQPTHKMILHDEKQDHEEDELDYDMDGAYDTRYTYANAGLELKKPTGVIRKETDAQRINVGGTGGNYYDMPAFSGPDDIVFLLDELHNDIADVPEFIVEDTLPYPTDTGLISGSGTPSGFFDWYSLPHSVTTGKWSVPDGYRSSDYRVYVYYSLQSAVPDWVALNPEGTPIDASEELILDVDYADYNERLENPVHKIKWVIRSDDPLNKGLPAGFRLDVDADESTSDVKEEKSQTDPGKENLVPHSRSIRDNSIRITMNAVASEARRQIIENYVELTMRYSEHDYAVVDTDSTQVLITQTKPTVDLKINTQYYGQSNGVFSWSNNLLVNPEISKFIKYSMVLTNGDKEMWEGYEEDYREDSLVNPVVVASLSPILQISAPNMTSFKHDEIDSDHPLSEDYTTTRPLEEPVVSGYWTWYLVPKDPDDVRSNIVMKEVAPTNPYNGPWGDLPREIVRFSFEGILQPGDQIVIEFLAEINDSNPNLTSSSDYSTSTEGRVYNQSGIITGIFTRENQEDHFLALAIDTKDLNNDGYTNDQVIETTSDMFSFVSYDNFPKRKIALSDLRPSGTTFPAVTPVAEGRNYTFKTSIQNTNAGVFGSKHNYPVIFDILPYVDDTMITGRMNDEGEYAMDKRETQWQGILLPDTIRLLLSDNSNTEAVVDESEYETWVGPVRVAPDGTLSAGDVSMIVSEDLRGPYTFYQDIIDNGEDMLRDLHFVTREEVLAVKDTDPEEYDLIIRNLLEIWIQFADKDFKMNPDTKYTLAYDMHAPLNVPYYPNDLTERVDWNDVYKYTSWNTNTAFRSGDAAVSDTVKAGVYVMERKGKVHIGDYVWWDYNQNGKLDEAGLSEEPEENGRDIYDQFRDLDGDGEIDDPGINGVLVELLTPDGFSSDKEGNRVRYCEADGKTTWFAVDQNGNVMRNEFQMPIEGGEPVTFETESDYKLRQGYYILSDLDPGDYQLRYTFPEEYDHHVLTTYETHGGDVPVTMYLPGDTLPDGTAAQRLTLLTEVFNLEGDYEDVYYVDFDIGVDTPLSYGGTVFQDESSNQSTSLNGIMDSNELRLQGYQVTLRTMDGEIATDMRGKKAQTVSEPDGTYYFDYLRMDQQYYITLEPVSGQLSIATPIMHTINPLEKKEDNDLYSVKLTDQLRTHPFMTQKNRDNWNSTEMRYNPDMSIDLGLIADSEGIIGDFVWDDKNRNGLQDIGEPGIPDVTVKLHRYYLLDGEWIFDSGFAEQSAQSGPGGFYYFKELDTSVVVTIDQEPVTLLCGYKVFVDELPDGYTLTLPKVTGIDPGVDYDTIDSDARYDGTMCMEPIIVAKEDEGSQFGYDIYRAVAHLTYDIGLTAIDTGSISGKVWNDQDRNGLINEGEEMLGYYEAALYFLDDISGAYLPVYRNKTTGEILITDTEPLGDSHELYQVMTDADGNYLFENLPLVNDERDPYHYRVRMSTPIEWTELTSYLSGGDEKRHINSKYQQDHQDENFAWSEDYILVVDNPDGSLDQYNLYQSEDVVDAHCGLFAYPTVVRIGDYIWNDENQNGKQDSGETGIADVKVTLYRFIPENPSDFNDVGEWVPYEDKLGNSTVTTDNNGYYFFDVPVCGLERGEEDFLVPYRYRISVERPVYSDFTEYEASGVDDSENSDFFSVLELVDGIDELAQDAAPLTGIPATLTSGISSEIVLVQSRSDKPGHVADFPTSAGNLDIDCGFIVNSSVAVIGDYVWDDKNANGVQDRGESGLEGYTASLYRYHPDAIISPRSDSESGSGKWLPDKDINGNSSVITDENGYYEFIVPAAGMDIMQDDYLMPYEYRVVFEKRPGDEHSPYRSAKGMPDKASNAIATTYPDGSPMDHEDLLYTDGIPTGEHLAVTPSIFVADWDELVEGEHRVIFRSVGNDFNQDYGVVAYHAPDVMVKIGDTVWQDLNENGRQDRGEPGVAGVKVQLYRLSFTEDKWEPVQDINGVDEIITGSDGKYLFEVPAADVDQSSDFFMQPYQYRFVYTKDEQQQFSPYYKRGDATEATDNDVFATQKAQNYQQSIPGIPIDRNIGASRLIQLAQQKETQFGILILDEASIRSDLDVDAGIINPLEEGEDGKQVQTSDSLSGTFVLIILCVMMLSGGLVIAVRRRRSRK